MLSQICRHAKGDFLCGGIMLAGAYIVYGFEYDNITIHSGKSVFNHFLDFIPF